MRISCKFSRPLKPRIRHYYLLKKLTSKHSVGVNCEADNYFRLDSLTYFLLDEDVQISNEGISVDVDYEHMYIKRVDTTSVIKKIK